ncbi:MAG: TolC family protein [Cytophagaceae bacterium]
MKRFVIFSIAFFIAAISSGQDVGSFTLEQCIQYALENQVNYKNAQLDVIAAKARVGEVRSSLLPHINASAGLRENTQLQRMFMDPNNPFAQGASGPPAGAEMSGGIIVMPNLFQLRSAGDASATVSQVIFDGTYILGLRASKNYKELIGKNLVRTKIQTVEGVMKAYYLVLINQERINQLKSSLARLDSSLRQTRAMYEAGFVEKIDVDRLSVAYNNLMTDEVKFLKGVELSKLILKFQMGMPVDQEINLTTSITQMKEDTTVLAVATTDYNSRIEYSILQSEKEMRELQVQGVRAGYFPTLSAFATGGFIRMDKQFSNLFTNKWYSYSLMGINLSVPVFDGFNKKYRSQQAKIEANKTENNITMLKNAIDLEVRQASVQLSNAKKDLEIQGRNVELAKEVVRVVKIKYREGVGSNLEVTNAEDELRTAQTNYYNALYDFIIAKIDYDKALGVLVKQ